MSAGILFIALECRADGDICALCLFWRYLHSVSFFCPSRTRARHVARSRFITHTRTYTRTHTSWRNECGVGGGILQSATVVCACGCARVCARIHTLSLAFLLSCSFLLSHTHTSQAQEFINDTHTLTHTRARTRSLFLPRCLCLYFFPISLLHTHTHTHT